MVNFLTLPPIIFNAYSLKTQTRNEINSIIMKHIASILLIFTASAFSLFSQTNNLILFTENGEKFQVVLNGILQNTNPETNVRLTQLPAPNYKCRVIFADTKLGQLDFNVYFQESAEELTMSVKQNKKGEYVSRYVSSIPIASAPPAPANQKIIVYTTVAPEVESVTTTISHSTTTTQTGSASSGDNVNIHMGVNMNEAGADISIQAGGMNMDDNLVESSTITTTTTHTVTSTTKGPLVVTPAGVDDVKEYHGNIGCPNPMDIADFQMMKQAIQSKDFESTRLSIAKQVLQENCLLAGQVNEILSLFDFENTKLEFAKYAYAYTYDTGNYFKVHEAFEFESSVEELNNYINTKN